MSLLRAGCQGPAGVYRHLNCSSASTWSSLPLASTLKLHFVVRAGRRPPVPRAQLFPVCLSGLLLAATSIGPAFGFITGSFMLRFFVDFDKLSEGEEAVLMTNSWTGTGGKGNLI